MSETAPARDYQLLIGGDWRPAADGRTYQSQNPYTGQSWATVPDAGQQEGSGREPE